MLDCNTYVIKGSPGIIIDPGSPGQLAERVAEMHQDGIEPADIGTIVNTHLHIDHCGGNEGFKRLSGAKIAMHPVQKANYELVVVEGARTFGMEAGEFAEDYIMDGNRLTCGETEIEMITAPGHSPDCVCYYLKKEKVLICGDVLFEANTGRVDLTGGSAEDLKISIESLAKLDIDLLLPGHMGIVAGAANVKENFNYIRFNVFPWL